MEEIEREKCAKRKRKRCEVERERVSRINFFGFKSKYEIY